jgi:TIR domain
MADVFVSYAREDRERVDPNVLALEDAGYSVWCDTRIGIGSSFDREIERELDDATCVVVVWSARSNPIGCATKPRRRSIEGSLFRCASMTFDRYWPFAVRKPQTYVPVNHYRG